MKRLIRSKKRTSGKRVVIASQRGSSAQKRRLGVRLKPLRSQSVTESRDGDARQELAIRNFEAAIRHFRRRKYGKAKEIFAKLADTAPIGIADRAKIHLRMCEQRLAPQARLLKTAEDYYVAGVFAMSAHQLDRAVECLRRSAKMDPNREETHYALAAAYALQHQKGPAIEHLEISIRLRPQNVVQARTDEDLRLLASDPRFSDLVHRAQPVAARSGA